MIEWDENGADLNEVVLMSDFDAANSVVYTGGYGDDAHKLSYRLVSKAVTYDGSYFTLLSAL